MGGVFILVIALLSPDAGEVVLAHLGGRRLTLQPDPADAVEAEAVAELGGQTVGGTGCSHAHGFTACVPFASTGVGDPGVQHPGARLSSDEPVDRHLVGGLAEPGSDGQDVGARLG